MSDSEERWRDGFAGRIECSSGEHARGSSHGTHEMWFDEPSYVGTDEHPFPHDSLHAAIGGCPVEVLEQGFEENCPVSPSADDGVELAAHTA